MLQLSHHLQYWKLKIIESCQSANRTMWNSVCVYVYKVYVQYTYEMGYIDNEGD